MSGAAIAKFGFANVGKLVFIFGIILMVISGINLPLIVFDWILKIINLFSGATFVSALINGSGISAVKNPFFIVYMTVVIISFVMAVFITIKSNLKTSFLGIDSERKIFRTSIEKYKWMIYWFLGIFLFPTFTIMLSWIASLITGLFTNIITTDLLLSQSSINSIWNKTNSYINDLYSFGNNQDVFNIIEKIKNDTNNVSIDELKKVINILPSQNVWSQIFKDVIDGKSSIDDLKKSIISFQEEFNDLLDSSLINFKNIGSVNSWYQFRDFLDKWINLNKNNDRLNSIGNIINNFRFSNIGINEFYNGNLIKENDLWIKALVFDKKPSISDIVASQLYSENKNSILVPEKITILLQKALFPTMTSNIYGYTGSDNINEIISLENNWISALFKSLIGIFKFFGNINESLFMIIGFMGVVGLINVMINIGMIVISRNFELVYLTCFLPFGTIQGIEDNGQKFETILRTIFGKIIIVFITSLSLNIFVTLLNSSIAIGDYLVDSNYDLKNIIMWELLFKCVVRCLMIFASGQVLLHMINWFSQLLNSDATIERKFTSKNARNFLNQQSKSFNDNFNNNNQLSNKLGDKIEEKWEARKQKRLV